MKTKSISSCILSILTVLLLGVSSCTEEQNAYLEAIPANAETVVAIDLKSIAQKAAFEKHPQLTQVIQELGSTFLPAEEAPAVNLLQAILQSPEECGINMDSPIYLFTEGSKADGKIGLAAQITDKEKALKWMEPLSIVKLYTEEQPQGQRFCDSETFKQMQQMKADITYCFNDSTDKQSTPMLSACHFEKGLMKIELQLPSDKVYTHNLQGKFVELLPASTCAVASCNIDFKSLLTDSFYSSSLNRLLGDQSEAIQSLLSKVNGEITVAVTESTGQLIPSMVLYAELNPTIDTEELTEELSDLGIPPMFYRVQHNKLVISNEVNRLRQPWQKATHPLSNELLGKNTTGKQVYAGIDAAKLANDHNWSLLVNPESMQMLSRLKLLELSMAQPNKMTLTLHANDAEKNILLTLIETFEALN